MIKFKVVILCIALFLVGCNSQTSENIEIGAILMLTGTGSHYGENSKNGIELAVQEINSNGGIHGRTLSIVYEDNKGDNPRQALNALHKLNAQGIQLIIGPNWSPSGQAIAPVACENQIIMISPTLGVSDFNEACDYLFNLWPHDYLASETLGRFVVSQGHKKIAVLGAQQAWEKTQAFAVKKGVEDAGGEVVTFLLTPPYIRDYNNEVAKIMNSEATAVIMTNYGTIEVAGKRLDENVPHIKKAAVLLDQNKVDAADGAFEETITVTSFSPTDTFREKYISHYGHEPDVSADTSYDAIMLLADAIEQTGSVDATVIKNYLNSLQTYSGASGFLTFTKIGAVQKPVRFLRVQENELVEFTP